MSNQNPSEDAVQARHRKKEQKVRNSCNACSSQKIRCSKDRPKCHRCTIKGLSCVYSMSRRTGERPRVLEASSVAIASPPMTPSRHDSLPPMPRGEGQTTVSASSTSLTDQFEKSGSFQDNISWMLESTPGPEIAVDSYFDVDLHDFAAGADCSASMTRTNPAEFLNTPSLQEFDLSYDFDCCSNDRRDTARMQPRRSECAASDPTSSSVGPRRSEREPQQANIHDCAGEALTLVADFHVPARGCLTGAKDGARRPDLEHGTFDTHDVETVLSRNREAMKKLNGILDCQCSLSQEVLVTVYLAMGKAISWYAGMLGDDHSAAEDQSHCTLVERIATKPVFMGSYCLDSQAQRIVSAHVVLTQLKEYVAPLVKRLVCRHSSVGSDTAMSSTRPPSPHPSRAVLAAGGLIECHHQVLQEQLNRLVLRANNIKQS